MAKVCGANIRSDENGLRRPGALSAVFCIWLLLGSGVALGQTLQQKAWEVLQSGLSARRTRDRAAAVSALGVVQADDKAIESAEKALRDKKPAVRAAAATALGQMDGRSSIPLLNEALTDKEHTVFFAAADSLIALGDPSGYDFYSEILTGERKSGQGLIAQKKRELVDPKSATLRGLAIGFSYAPYSSYGWIVWREFSKSYAAPVRINALKQLANDPDSRIGKSLVKAASDKHSSVRVAALSAIAHHGDPDLIGEIAPHMMDKKAAVRYTAAAAILRLSALVPVEDTSNAPNSARTPK